MKYQVYHGEVDIDYAFSPAKNKSDKLVIEFPGRKIVPPGRTELYKSFLNFAFELKDVNSDVHCLYFVDGFFPVMPTIPYCVLGGDFAIERSFIALVDKIKAEYGIKEVITIGVSGGGSASLYYGLKYNWYVFAASPVYHCHKYNENKYYSDDYRDEIAVTLSGKQSIQEAIEFTSELIPNVLKHSNHTKKIFLGYGSREKIYPTQCLPLIDDLRKKSIQYELETEDWAEHGLCVQFMKKRLVTKVKTIFNLIPSKGQNEEVHVKFIRAEDKSLVQQTYSITNWLLHNYTDNLESKNVNLDLKNCIPNRGTPQHIFFCRENAYNNEYKLETNLRFNHIDNLADIWDFEKYPGNGSYSLRLSFSLILNLISDYAGNTSSELVEKALCILREYFIICDELVDLPDNVFQYSAYNRCLLSIELLVRLRRHKIAVDNELISNIKLEIVKSLKLMLAFQNNTHDIDFFYNRGSDFALITASACFKSDKTFSDICCKSVLKRLVTYMNYAHNGNGVFWNRQISTTDFVFNYYYSFIDSFYVANGFDTTINEYKAFKVIYDKIKESNEVYL